MNLRTLCKRYNIKFNKRLGQNLLLDDNIHRIMADAAALVPEDDVIEVGAGLGALTAHLCRHAGRVLAVEIDRTFMPCLEDRFREQANVRLFRGDILNHSLPKLIEEFLPGRGSPACGLPRGASYKMVSNLPYYITTPILFHFLESPLPPARIVVMVQEEVGVRMTAPPDSPGYSALAAVLACHASVDLVHRVPRTCFVPMPEVNSCIVRLRRHETPPYPGVETRFLTTVIRSAFLQRRKTLRNALTRSGEFGAPKEAVLA
ncbi:MAG: 16S rRNA (adenine(1518)-N(6)/adenine(1519)-N(6))-dimethyltransferase RsmA, partial [Candidatus Hydrogenedentes bacterium]|nr:16S rRNA (adenine(1518)-N(6)/adenine(1519)-N(6))-dimethyltransferase RsmA [Candidatus Hydrogenedentota bacterium]